MLQSQVDVRVTKKITTKYDFTSCSTIFTTNNTHKKNLSSIFSALQENISTPHHKVNTYMIDTYIFLQEISIHRNNLTAIWKQNSPPKTALLTKLNYGVNPHIWLILFAFYFRNGIWKWQIWTVWPLFCIVSKGSFPYHKIWALLWLNVIEIKLSQDTKYPCCVCSNKYAITQDLFESAHCT